MESYGEEHEEMFECYYCGMIPIIHEVVETGKKGKDFNKKYMAKCSPNCKGIIVHKFFNSVKETATDWNNRRKKVLDL